MQRRWAYLLAIASILVGCGEEATPIDLPSSPATDEALSLTGSRWVEGQGKAISSVRFDPRAGQVSVVVFFRAGDPNSQRALTALAKLQRTHPQLDAYGATPDGDDALIAKDRVTTGAAFPILLGVSRNTRDVWEVQDLPALRATNAKGQLVARSMMGVLARLEDSAAK